MWKCTAPAPSITGNRPSMAHCWISPSANAPRQRCANRKRGFRTVVESLGEGVVITDINDAVIYINSRMADLCGYAPEEMIGKPAYTLLLPQDKWAAMKERNKERLLGKPDRYEIFMTRKDGKRFWVEINATPYRDNDGKIIGTLGAVTDIQERKRAETLQSALYRIAEKTHSTVDLQEFYSSVHSIISTLMSAKNFYIALYDASTQILSFPYFADEVDPQPSSEKAWEGIDRVRAANGPAPAGIAGGV